jgi:hypothetical protein
LIATLGLLSQQSAVKIITMRKILIAVVLLILVVIALGAAWIYKGRDISLFVDRYGTNEVSSEPVKSVRYEGNGTGGILHVDSIALSLNHTVPPLSPPSVGSTKNGDLGLASSGKVFPLGPLPKTSDDASDVLATTPGQGDHALVSIERGKLSWPSPVSLNFVTGISPSWKRHSYQRLTWTKPNGGKLEMQWRYEQNFDPVNGWSSATMMRDGETGLIKIDITP